MAKDISRRPRGRPARYGLPRSSEEAMDALERLPAVRLNALVRIAMAARARVLSIQRERSDLGGDLFNFRKKMTSTALGRRPRAVQAFDVLMREVQVLVRPAPNEEAPMESLVDELAQLGSTVTGVTGLDLAVLAIAFRVDPPLSEQHDDSAGVELEGRRQVWEKRLKAARKKLPGVGRGGSSL